MSKSSSHPCQRITSHHYATKLVHQPYQKHPLNTITHHNNQSRANTAKMAANFAPYQDSPEASRLASPRASLDRPRVISPQTTTPGRAYEQHDYFQGQPPSPAPLPETERSWTASRRREDVDVFTTSLGWRLDYEACLAYLLLPPAGGVFLLVMEHQSDYVRFHAWQSSLLFAFLFVVHVFFSWSGFISWVLFVGDVGLIAWLTWKAYQDGEFFFSFFEWGDLLGMRANELCSCDTGSV
ncbi:hypothetical protein P153DRAFT_363330 [Dothidotthia symphoricarpi CBS 119687]|uniref:Uncharacterized protein n=1 Tax=Dothidotthia symphoricarpi CBS 119687 TaxID=1392245 RepID=A0A6A6ARG0_9PLEO|nr:uncharacterized protein P153DRAFT_363330 [Dothidotthia symphoricarpi CBS 119687]KAF2133101.1 hypothetical protein P153DRAFT_363330 [Dothidotthia symphoricarpi CBS 119687]